jgi:AGZA family xanthine/uracil permease-like MFS transporter
VPALDRFFGIQEAGSTVRREIIGGITTFATMSYIVFVQPTVLSAAGMPFGSVLLATCIASALACFLMGLLANYPVALAPGMGENFLFAFTVCGAVALGGMGFSWQAGLAIVLIEGLLFVLLSLFGAREKLIGVLPDCLKNAIGPAIGFFIAFVGLQWGGVIVHSPATMVMVGDLTKGPPLLTLAGVLFITSLLALGVRSAILIGILASAGLAVALQIVPIPNDPLTFSVETFFNLDFGALLANWQDALVAIALLFFLDLFDTVGTLVGVGKQAGYIDEHGQLPRAREAFFSDAAGTCIGAVCGTSTVTSYVESATGVAAGARTGLAAVTTGVCFLLAIALAPVVRVVGYNIGPEFYGADSGLYISMYPAVAPALIVVGFIMIKPLQQVKWDDFTEGFPAFFTIAGMVLGYAIIDGIAWGCISYTLIKLCTGRYREIHWVMYLVTVALLFRYGLLM